MLDRRTFFKYSLTAAAIAGGLYLRRGGPPALAVEGQPSFTGFAGRTLDALDERPVPGALVMVASLGLSAKSDGNGAYRLELPEGHHTVVTSAAGYIEMAQTKQAVLPGVSVHLDFALIQSHLADAEQQLLYERLVGSRRLAVEGGEQGDAVGAAPDARDAGVSVPADIRVRFPDGHEEWMSLDEYLKGVVPSEVPPAWPAAALRAQSVAARSYAVSYVNARGYICTTAACQVWSPTHYATTDAAVQDTSGVVATYNGQTISANFFSRCNGITTLDSERAINWQTCAELGWGYVPYLRARSCGGHAPHSAGCGYYGHGVGLCQWGVKARADEGLSYAEILRRYYTNIELTGAGAPPGGPTYLEPHQQAAFALSQPITFTWSGQGTEFLSEYWSAGGSPVTSGWRSVGASGRSWSVGTLPPGWYSWHVKERNEHGEGPWSATVSFQVLGSQRVYLPRLFR